MKKDEEYAPEHNRMRALEVLILKEQMLAEIMVWLKAKGLWEECQKALSIKVTRSGKEQGQAKRKDLR